jgi:hypothetical protein
MFGASSSPSGTNKFNEKSQSIPRRFTASIDTKSGMASLEIRIGPVHRLRGWKRA